MFSSIIPLFMCVVFNFGLLRQMIPRASLGCGPPLLRESCNNYGDFHCCLNALKCEVKFNSACVRAYISNNGYATDKRVENQRAPLE